MPDVRNQAVSALGNIAADSPSCRDLVLSHGALIPLLLSHLNEQADNLSMLRNAAWALSNFCTGKPLPSLEQVLVIFVKLKLNPARTLLYVSVLILDFYGQVRPALPALQRLLLSNDAEVLEEACWVLCSLFTGTIDEIQAVIEAGVCGRLVQLLL
jgi:importin subunit alpha-6/7